jgi:hypothetical protein
MDDDSTVLEEAEAGLRSYQMVGERRSRSMQRPGVGLIAKPARRDQILPG